MSRSSELDVALLPNSHEILQRYPPSAAAKQGVIRATTVVLQNFDPFYGRVGRFSFTQFKRG